MFETSRQLGRIPVIAVRGETAAEHTAWLRHFLQLPLLQGSVVLTPALNREAELGYDRVQAFVPARAAGEGDCLCCGMNSGLGDALRSLFLRVLTKRTEPLDRVVIDALTLDPAQLALTLKHAPFLGQRYVYQMTVTVKGA